MHTAWGCALAALFWLPAGAPEIRHFAPDYSTGVVEFDLFNAASQPLAAWSVELISYDQDGAITGRSSQDEVRVVKPEEYIAPGASRHFRWDMGTVENNLRPPRIALEVTAYALADLTAEGDPGAIRRWAGGIERGIGSVRKVLGDVDRKIAAGDPDTPTGRETLLREIAQREKHVQALRAQADRLKRKTGK